MSKTKTLLYSLQFISFFTLLNSAEAQKTYTHVFNPMRGFVNEAEKPFRGELYLNGKWQFMPVYETNMAAFVKSDQFQWDAVPLKVPSPWNVNAFSEGDGGDILAFSSYPKAGEKAQMGWMKKEFVLPENWADKQLKLHFETIAGVSYFQDLVFLYSKTGESPFRKRMESCSYSN